MYLHCSRTLQTDTFYFYLNENMLLRLFVILNLVQIYNLCLLRSNEGKCYGDLGCFPTGGDFFHPIYRPINPDPQSPEEINITYHFYTRKNPDTEQIISRHDNDSIKSSNFDPKKKTIFVVHGFNDRVETGGWMIKMSKVILNVDDVNVILVDWSKGANPFPRSDLSIPNARVVGRDIGNLIKRLQEIFAASPKDMHIIGHSLGAHAAGYTGKWLNEPNNTKIGEITGLDPAGIFFQYMPESVRLVPSDASFVNVIHSNGRPTPYTSFGLYQESGHVDFYPDGGKISNDCEEDFRDIINEAPIEQFIGKMGSLVGCSHKLSIEMYIESINKHCPFISYACENVNSFRQAKCYTCENVGYDCRPMGYYTDHYPYDGLMYRRYFLTTTDDQSGLCAFHWVIEILIAEEQKEVSGDFFVSAQGKKYNYTKHKLNKQGVETISPGKTYRYMLTFEQNPVKILLIRFSWSRTFVDTLLDRTVLLRVKSLTLISIENIDQNKRKQDTQAFCDSSLQELKSDTEVTVEPSTDC